MPRAPGPRRNRRCRRSARCATAAPPLGYDPAAFAEMAEMGWTGVIIPEEYGGSDFGYLSLGLVLEETGRTLTASPLLATALAAASAIVLGGSDAQKEAWLPKIAAGELVATLAVDEGAHHAPDKVALAATASGAGYTPVGQARPSCSKAWPPACSWSRPAPRASPGDTDGDHPVPGPRRRQGRLTRKALKLADSRGAANLTFDGRRGRRRRGAGRSGQGLGPAGKDPRPRPRRPGRRDAGRRRPGVRDHPRLSEDPGAVRPGDRLVPGAAAPRGQDVHRPGAGALLRRGGADGHRQRRRRRRRNWSRWPRPRSATPCTWSPTRWSRCTAASA